MTATTTLTRESLTAEEREIFDHSVSFWRHRLAFDLAQYEEHMRTRRSGVCYSGFDPSPVVAATEADLEAQGFADVMKRRRLTVREPFQVILNIIGNRMSKRDADCAELARSLTFASQNPNHHLANLAPRLDAVAQRHPDLIRDVVDAKHCIDAMVMLVPEAA
jgi:hypothetical protein